MTPLQSDTSSVFEGWEAERDTERAKLNARWFGVIVLYLATLRVRNGYDPTQEPLPALNLTALTVASLLLIAAEALFLWRPGMERIPRWFKYLTVLGDISLVSVLIYYTGLARSPFFFVYFVFLVSNCLRYGLLMALYVALLVNVEYVIVLGLAPPEKVQPAILGGEGLKLLAFWGTALYGGTISARLRRQANQMRAYETTIEELRAELAASREERKEDNYDRATER